MLQSKLRSWRCDFNYSTAEVINNYTRQLLQGNDGLRNKIGIWNLESLHPSLELIPHARLRVSSPELTGGRNNTILLAQFFKQESRTGWMDIFYLSNVLSISHWCLEAAELRSIGRHTVARWEWKMRLKGTLVEMQRYMSGMQAVRPRPSSSSLFFLRESTSVVALLTRLAWLRRWLSGEGASCANMRTCVHVPSICVKRELQNKSVAPVLCKGGETNAGVHWLASLVEEATSRIARRRPCLKHTEWESEGRLSC